MGYRVPAKVSKFSRSADHVYFENRSIVPLCLVVERHFEFDHSIANEVCNKKMTRKLS